MSAQEFKAAFQQDAAGAITAFINGLACGSQSVIVMLDEMGIKEARFRDALLRITNATKLLDGLYFRNGTQGHHASFLVEHSVGSTCYVMKFVPRILNNIALDSGNKIIRSVLLGYLGDF